MRQCSQRGMQAIEAARPLTGQQGAHRASRGSRASGGFDSVLIAVLRYFVTPEYLQRMAHIRLA